jgi:hypothetical protein
VRTESPLGEYNGSLMVHFGNGTGGLAEPVALRARDNRMLPFVLAAGDLQGDGKEEIVALDPTVDEIVTVWIPQ